MTRTSSGSRGPARLLPEYVSDTNDIPIPGVVALDHTADVGLAITARDLPALFRRASLGSIWLVLERQTAHEYGDGDLPPECVERTVELIAEDLASLLRGWLRTILFWEESEGFVATDPRVALVPAPLCGRPDGQAFGLKARVLGVMDFGPRIREIKGVTLHGLRVEGGPDGWYAQVIFDV